MGNLFSGRCTSKARLDGKVALITGGNTGIGKLTAKDFYQRGARVILACRDMGKAEKAASEIRKGTAEGKTGELRTVRLDLSSLESVRCCAEELLKSEERVDILVNNAGVMVCPEGKTEDGFETHFGTNHLGHFLLTLLLLPTVIRSQAARVVNVSSMAHIGGRIEFDDLNWEKRTYSAMQAYCQSKLANILFTKELARRLDEANINTVKTYSLHPGVVDTELCRNLQDTYFWGLNYCYWILAFFMKTPEEGAQTTIYCAVDERAADETGLYYQDCVARKPSREALNAMDAKRLWDVSLELVGLPANFDPLK